MKVKTLNIQKTNIVEKGIGNVLLEYQFEKAINKYYNNTKFDLVLYSTPPITLTRIIDRIKKRNSAGTYLLLKDIFPQNAVDLEYKMPVLMATDVNTDIGSIAQENGYSLWCKNGDIDKFNSLLDTLITNRDLRYQMGENGYKFLEENYTVDKSYKVIMKHYYNV